MKEAIIDDLLVNLSYEGCDCLAEYKPELHIFNGKCSKHQGRLLLKGETIEVHRKNVLEKVREFFGLTNK
jgi:predicted HicB family RNase H-like nuclease